MAIRYGRQISDEEIHDLLDALHNIPEMLLRYGDWFIEENIDQEIRHYFSKWRSNRDTKDTFDTFLKSIDDRKGRYDF